MVEDKTKISLRCYAFTDHTSLLVAILKIKNDSNTISARLYYKH